MKSFNVLDRHLNIRKNFLLEASAGTGKTFSIENIVVRLLLEDDPKLGEPLQIEKILVVTFTRAAARDLKIRIRSNIERNLNELDLNLSIQESKFADAKPNPPDYLSAIIEKGEKEILKRKRLLESALFSFDQAQIFTIHSFCAQMLRLNVFEGDIGLDSLVNDQQMPDSEVLKVIRDFFRTEIRGEIYSPEQLKIILKENDNKIENLENRLLKTITSGLQIFEQENFSQLLEKFSSILKGLIENHRFNSTKLIEDFENQIPFYKKQGDFEEVLAKAKNFARLFDRNDWGSSDLDMLIRDGLIMARVLDPRQLKANANPPAKEDLHFPFLIETLKKSLLPLIEKAQSYPFIFALMAFNCQKMLQKYLKEEERFRFDDFLHKTLDALKNAQFKERILSQYQAAIIDEFQDTDPIQWEIFNTLFLKENKKTYLYLVGDPKQSIYAFRQADIYTYLTAANEIGVENQSSLDTNYRSQPSLVRALNVLFSSSSCPQMIELPRIKKALEYPEVKFSPNIEEYSFSDTYGSLHFYVAEVEKKVKSLPLNDLEEQYFFPFMVQEIQRLHQQDKISFNQFAVLVKDSSQAERAAAFFHLYNIPVALQRNSSLAESCALTFLKELLIAVLNPKDESSLKTALGGRIIGWTHTEILKLQDQAALEKILNEFYLMRTILFKQGYAFFFNYLMHSSWQTGSQTIIESILSQEQGIDFYQDLQQIAHLVIEFQCKTHASADRLLTFLDEFSILQLNDDDRIKKQSDPNRDAIQILTIHSSKGLEFDIVFALGLVKRTPKQDQLIPIHDGEIFRLVPILDKNSLTFQEYSQECDAEKLRQLYVAMTRAKYRLYVPVIFAPQAALPELGCASPMELFLAKLGQDPIQSHCIYERISSFQIQNLYNFINKQQPDIKISYSRLNEMVFKLTKFLKNTPIQLNPPSEVKIPGKPQFVYSFTSLAHQLQKYNAAENVTVNNPKDFQNSIKNIHTLPSGSSTGVLIHRILESFPFQEAKQIASPQSLEPWIGSYLRGTEYQEWNAVFCEMVFNSLRVSLNAEDEVFCLAEIDPFLCYKETEFLYPYEGNNIIEEFAYSSGFLKGVMDLVFSHKGKYYFIDWKSNWLGPGQDDYCQDRLAIAMKEHDYFLQASIYTEALKRYLSLVDKRNFADIFGGIFYIFIRGLKAGQQSSPGIFYFKNF